MPSNPAGDPTVALKDLPEWLSPGEVAAVTRWHIDTVHRRLRTGELPGVKLGGRWRVRRVDVAALLEPTTPAQRRAALLGAETIAYIKELAEKAPPLSEAQRDGLRAIFRGDPGDGGDE